MRKHSWDGGGLQIPMNRFTVLTSIILPLPIDNIDTDRIIPARYLKAVKLEGLGTVLFYDLRYDEQGKKKDSIFWHPRYKKAAILLTGKNFGIGSSREHAVWALADYGFKVIIASSFGDIFYQNALKNGLLVIRLKRPEIELLFQLVKKQPEVKITVDLANQKISVEKIKLKFHFDVAPFIRSLLVSGIDELGFLLSLDKKIAAFEALKK